jgi:hypothetical protein
MLSDMGRYRRLKHNSMLDTIVSGTPQIAAVMSFDEVGLLSIQQNINIRPCICQDIFESNIYNIFKGFP